MKYTWTVIILAFFLSSCAVSTTAPTDSKAGGEIKVPEPPKAVIMESKGIDKKKYPNAIWIKKPEIIPDKEVWSPADIEKIKKSLKGKAAWSFEDVAKISESLMEWTTWADNVKEIINKHNQDIKNQVGGGGESRWKFW